MGLIQAKNRNRRRNRNLQSRYDDTTERQKTEESSQKHEGIHYWKSEKEGFRVTDKNLIMYGQLCQNRHLQDSIDWLEAMGRMSNDKVVEFLKFCRDRMVFVRRCDPARLYINTWQTMRGKFVKSLIFRGRHKMGIRRSPRNRVRIGLREMSKEEYFQKTYIIGKLPQCVSDENISWLPPSESEVVGLYTTARLFSHAVGLGHSVQWQ